MKVLKKALFYLKVSRPGLWFASIWLYMLPTSQIYSWDSTPFWLGLIYVTFPLNFMVYGWNDMVDRSTDAINPRKDTFWFGARASKNQLLRLWLPILIVQVICWTILLTFTTWKVLLILPAFITINTLYNLPKHGLRGRPPLELLCQIGYLLIVPFSIWINNTSHIPVFTYIYLFLFATKSHLIGEVMDIIPDKSADRKTTATVLGVFKTKLLIIALLSLEIIILCIFFEAFIFAMMLSMGLIWLLLDLFVIFKTKTYTLPQMKLFGLLSNIMALATMIYAWFSGCLTPN